jgi:growth hormone-inducible transmembrane protein
MSSLVATSYLVHNIPYQKGLGAKQVAWFLHSLIIGAAIAPPCLLGGPAIIRAAL